LPRRTRFRDRLVPLSRTRIPLFVVQHRLCSVHAAAAFPRLRRQLCVVNVKLTMRLAAGAGTPSVFASTRGRFSPGAGAGATQGGSSSEVIARGGVGMFPPAKRSVPDKGGPSQPSLFASYIVFRTLVSRTRCIVLHDAPLSRDPWKPQRVDPGSAAHRCAEQRPGHERVPRTCAFRPSRLMGRNRFA